MPARLLIVEDDTALNQMLCLHFEDDGYAVTGARTCAEAEQKLTAGAYDLALLDQQLPDGTGLELLGRILGSDSHPLVVMITGQHDLELAIEAIKQGAADFVHKPIRTAELEATLRRLLEDRRLAAESQPVAESPHPAPAPRELIGRSDAMLAVSKSIALSAQSAATLLITGESGTGKEVVARLVHQHSGRSGRFVAVNCAAIVDTLLESELFGHEKGAFTGAVGRKDGRFELARDGTLFLDEIGELAPQLQAKFLRALQAQVFERVGGTEPIHTNARVIAATHRDLWAEVKAGRFREDLLYRLNVLSIRVPPLRERKEDIPLLAEALIDRISRQVERPALPLTPEALAKLRAHSWSGNVRELENLLTQALVRARGGLLTPDLLPLPEKANSDTPPDGVTAFPAEALVLRSLDEVEATHIQQVLEHTGGHKARTCEILRISRPSLDRKIQKYHLSVPNP